MFKDLIDKSDCILGIRESIGAGLGSVSLVVRTWSGGVVGSGEAHDATAVLSPTPGIKRLSKSLRLVEGGRVQQGDIELRGISRLHYPDIEDLEALTDDPGVEKFYEVDGKLYVPIEVIKKHMTWNVVLRLRSDQTRGIDGG